MRMLSTSLLAAVAAAAAGAGSAHADTFCVTPATGCDAAHSAPTIAAGLAAAETTPGADTVQLGAATYSENSIDYDSADPVMLVGAGPDLTTVQRKTPQDGVTTIEGKGAINLSSLRVHLLASKDVVGTSSPGTVYENLRFDADPGATTPRAIELDADGSTLRGSVIDMPSGGQCIYVTTGDAVGSRVEDTQIKGCSTGIFASSGTLHVNRTRIDGGQFPVDAAGGATTIDDSVLRPAAGGTGVLLALSSNGGATVRVRHSDVIGTGTGTGVESFNHVKAAAANLIVTDSVVRGFTHSGVRDGNAGHPANLSLDHASYALGTVTSAGPGTYSHTNILDDPDPLFADAAAGDFRLLAGSPLLDQDPAPLAADEPAVDLAGSVRVIGTGADIGAFERVLAPAATTGDASAVTQTGATAGATLNGGGATGTWQILYGTTAAYGAATPAQPLAAALADQPLSAALGGLSPSTTYHYAVRLTTAAGTVTGADRTFTTAAPPVPPQQDPPVKAAGLSKLSLSPSAFRAARTGGTLPAKATRGAGTRLRFTLTKAATVTFTVRRVSTGVRSGKRCLAKRAGRHGKACRIETRTGRAFGVKAKAGTTTLRFSGRLSGRRLSAGRYVLTAQPAGGTARRIGFRIVR